MYVYLFGNIVWSLMRMYKRSSLKIVKAARISKDMLTPAKPGKTGFANSLFIARFVECSDSN